MSFTFIPLAFAEENECYKVVNDHITLITKSQTEIENIVPHSETITSYEIASLQKNLTKRYESLKKVISLYETPESNCRPVSLGRATAIYDFTLIGESVFKDKHLRRVFKGFSKFQDYRLEDYIPNYKKYTSNEYVQATIDLVAKEQAELPADYKVQKLELGYNPDLYKVSDRLLAAASGAVAGVARVWGFISDRTMWRQGWLKDNQKAKELLLKNLKPLDLVYETRNFTLSNYTIPGQWGHVGVWLGTKEELIALGLWDKDSFKEFREKVEQGFQIVEIRKEGVNYQKLDTFINLDEIAITRLKNIQERADEVFLELAAQLAKTYDYKFDSRSLSKITCAELITFSYGNIKWRETKTLFQYSLRPDDLAMLSIEQPDLSEFVLFLKGQKDSQEFLNLDFNEWKLVLTADKIKKQKKLERAAKLEKERKEREEFLKLYTGG